MSRNKRKPSAKEQQRRTEQSRDQWAKDNPIAHHAINNLSDLGFMDWTRNSRRSARGTA